MDYPQRTVTYKIRVEGQLDQRWLEWFDGLNLAYADNGETILTGAMPDQAALYGLLMKMRDLGLTLVSVTRVEHDSPTDASSP
jgi:hypothetical protein